MELTRIDDEHNLIARYAAKLASMKTKPVGIQYKATSNSRHFESMEPFSCGIDYKAHQNLIDELEASNKQIMEEISQLKQAKEASDSGSSLLIELQMLKQHRYELENRMSKLHDGRQDLMDQLQRLMAMLKTRDRSGIASSHRKGSTSPRLSLSSCSSPTHQSLSNGTGSPHLLTHQQSLSSHSSPSTTTSRTKRQFIELFDAAEAINDALTQLVDQFTEDNESHHAPDQPAPVPRRLIH